MLGRSQKRRASAGKSLALFFASFLLSLWVLALNQSPTSYFDTGAYLERGAQLISMAGLSPPEFPHQTAQKTAPEAAATATEPETIEGSRAMTYSLILGILLLFRFVEGVALMNAALAVGTVFFAFSVLLRQLPQGPSWAWAAFWAVAISSIGSLPFYVAFLMPDVFAPVLILLLALLVACAPNMTRFELAIAVLLGSLAVTVHLSHLAIALLTIPLVAAFALVSKGEKRWLATLATVVIAAAGIAEQAVLRIAAKEQMDAEIIYRPFLTARLIQDGPGLSYLEDYCPNTEEPSCILYDALRLSEDPLRLTATNISFSKNPSTGSFQFLSASEQIGVAQDQFRFFVAVFLDRPFETAAAFATNVVRQMLLGSVDMTLQTDAIVNRNEGFPGMAFGSFEHGPLTADTNWLATADAVHGALYVISALFLAWVLITRRLPKPVALFIWMILLGVLVNAIVTGGLSQPANRYGARVMWLLPAAAALAGMVLLSLRRAALVHKSDGSKPRNFPIQ